MIVSTITKKYLLLHYEYKFILSVAVMFGFTDENYSVTEGVDMFTDVTVGLMGEIEQNVVVTVSTQPDSAKGTFI
jgi:hypothetical protein